MVALVAVMRKLICILNTMIKKNQNWQLNLIKIAWFSRQSLSLSKGATRGEQSLP
jgi:hypothetical protein